MAIYSLEGMYPVWILSAEPQNFSQFGIKDILGFYNCIPEEPHGPTLLFSRDALYWNILKGKPKHQEA
jgi:hypothetical protein